VAEQGEQGGHRRPVEIGPGEEATERQPGRKEPVEQVGLERAGEEQARLLGEERKERWVRWLGEVVAPEDEEVGLEVGEECQRGGTVVRELDGGHARAGAELACQVLPAERLVRQEQDAGHRGRPFQVVGRLPER